MSGEIFGNNPSEYGRSFTGGSCVSWRPLARTRLTISRMKLTNSLGFLSIGSVMFLLPQWVSSLCPVDVDGFSVRSVWLHLMGLVQVGIGASYLLRKAGKEFAAWLERWPELVNAGQLVSPQTYPPEPPATPAPAHPISTGEASRPLADVIPVEFGPDWAEEPGRAA